MEAVFIDGLGNELTPENRSPSVLAVYDKHGNDIVGLMKYHGTTKEQKLDTLKRLNSCGVISYVYDKGSKNPIRQHLRTGGNLKKTIIWLNTSLKTARGLT